MVSWFKSKDLTDGNTWVSSVGSYTGSRNAGSIGVTSASGNGASGSVKYMYGNTAATFNFGNVVHSSFTLCTLARYSGVNKKRMFLGGSNFLHGFWNTYPGVSHYDGWKTPSSPNANYGQTWGAGSGTWIAQCGQNSNNIPYSHTSNGFYVGTTTGGNGNLNLGINHNFNGGCCSEDDSDFNVAEVLLL